MRPGARVLVTGATGYVGGRLVPRSEMKLPGEALLEFTIVPLPTIVTRCRLVQTARFLPRGLFGIAYWYAVTPLHGIVFGRMLAGIRRVAETLAADETPAPSGSLRSPASRI